MSKTSKKEVPVTAQEAAAILQSAVSYAKEAGIVIFQGAGMHEGKEALFLVAIGLTAHITDDGEFVIQVVENAGADNGTLETGQTVVETSA